MFVYQNLNMRLFSHVPVIFTAIQKVWLATNSQNAILDNFEEYYINNELNFSYVYRSVNYIGSRAK